MTVDAYLANVPEASKRSELERIRRFVEAMVPDVEQTISYGMPAFRYNGKYLLGYAAFKDHMSIFPTSAPVAELKDQLQDYKLAKGTIQFTVEHPLTDSLLEQIVASCLLSINNRTS